MASLIAPSCVARLWKIVASAAIIWGLLSPATWGGSRSSFSLTHPLIGALEWAEPSGIVPHKPSEAPQGKFTELKLFLAATALNLADPSVTRFAPAPISVRTLSSTPLLLFDRGPPRILPA